MKLSETIRNFIQAFNEHDTNRLLELLNDGALVHDEGHDYRGIAEIKNWFEEKAVAPNVTLEPIQTMEKEGKTIVTAKVDGNFDKTGLPDPLKLDYDFTIDMHQVVVLSIEFPETRKPI